MIKNIYKKCELVEASSLRLFIINLLIPNLKKRWNLIEKIATDDLNVMIVFELPKKRNYCTILFDCLRT
jgi:hypothetical protein